jgi:hypothetical protein
MVEVVVVQSMVALQPQEVLILEEAQEEDRLVLVWLEVQES